MGNLSCARVRCEKRHAIGRQAYATPAAAEPPANSDGYEASHQFLRRSPRYGRGRSARHLLSREQSWKIQLAIEKIKKLSGWQSQRVLPELSSLHPIANIAPLHAAKPRWRNSAWVREPASAPASAGPELTGFDLGSQGRQCDDGGAEEGEHCEGGNGFEHGETADLGWSSIPPLSGIPASTARLG